MNSNDSLIIIDMQNDFCPEGALAIDDGDKIVPMINRISGHFKNIAATQDWHPENHISFASNHKDRKIYEEININGIEQVLWPDHCIAGTKGAEFHKDLITDSFNIIIRKGIHTGIDSYSTFLENDRKTKTGLDGYLKSLNIENIYLCGLATDYCVYYSAMDAIDLGFKTSVIIDACKGIDIPEGSLEKVINIMKDSGIEIIKSSEITNEE